MASSDNRPAFRLPWQSGHGSDGESDAATAVAEPPAWPSHDLARRVSQGAKSAPTADTTDSPVADPTATDATDATEAPEATMTPTDTATAPTSKPTSTAGATATATETRTRKPTKFLADLTRAMLQAANESRQAVLDQFNTDVEQHLDAARATCDEAAQECRQRADADISTLGEWETAEIARIRREAEEGIAARHGRLDSELGDLTSRLDGELTRVTECVTAFEQEMDGFFQRLSAEEDPARFAGMAEQLPEPPTFEPWHADVDATAMAMTDAATGPDTSDAMPGEATMERAGDATAPADAMAETPTMDAEPAADMTAPDAEMAPEAEAVAETPAEMPADAEPETPTEATAEAESTPEPATTDAPKASAPWPPATTTVTTVRTQVAVVGLVSVASIATFKRLLARCPGVHNVQVSSGPDGEFLFTATHDDTCDMPAAVASIQGFEVEVVESGPGIVSARAVDPEVL
jgi:hypothetical protein